MADHKSKKKPTEVGVYIFDGVTFWSTGIDSIAADLKEHTVKVIGSAVEMVKKMKNNRELEIVFFLVQQEPPISRERVGVNH